MSRRPPDEGRLVARQRTKALLGWAVLLLPWLSGVDALQQQQQARAYRPQAAIRNVDDANHHDGYRYTIDDAADSSGQRRRRETLQNGNQAHERVVATSAQSLLDNQGTPTIGYKSTVATVQHRYDDSNPSKFIQIPDDASAIATTSAPAPPVRAPGLSRQLSSLIPGAGLSSPHHTARSLADWEVEDFVLLATVDGHLHAIDRETGALRWHLNVEQPVVETIHHNMSSFADAGSDARHPWNANIWAIEPTRNGPLYVWTPSGLSAGLMSTGLTMKQLVDDHVPYAVADPPVVYNGHKTTTLITLDAMSGRVLRWWGPSSPPQMEDTATCYRPNGRFVDEDEECISSGTITLSRTEYTVTIDHRDKPVQIATLKYSEWGPNNADSDLHSQHHQAFGNQYITSRTDGKLYVMGPSGKWSISLESSVPVANVFDIARPEDAPAGSNPELVLLPQPIPPLLDTINAMARNDKVFLNQTETGSWYAMSGLAYPLILDAPAAPLSRSRHWNIKEDSPKSTLEQISEALVGTHAVGQGRANPHAQWPTALPSGLPGRPEGKGEDEEVVVRRNQDGSGQVTSKIAENISHLPDIVTENILSIPDYMTRKATDFLTNPVVLLVGIYFLITKRRDISRYLKGTSKAAKEYGTTITLEPTEQSPRQAPPVDTGKVSDEETAPVAEPKQVEPEQTAVSIIDKEVSPEPEIAPVQPPKQDDSPVDQDSPPAGNESPEKKKKAHRGRRGGVKHRKGIKKQESTASDELNDAVPGIRNVGMPTKIEPNITTINNDPEDVSGPILRIGDIEVNQDVQLGMGSNGTVVFSGKFHGRDVAVKRMLTQFWEIATQETRLLLESDKHPNVIQYFAMSKSDSFLYIALELCQASLSDVVDKPQLFPKLAQAGEMDMPRVLLQIAHGLSFLHDLRIVHRDLKPHNILVTMGRDGKPRLLVSDFGLCKKLEGGQSSFGATTAHAAGTSGWRAPELLLDDDAREGPQSISSIHSDSSALVGSDAVPNRRATRAIDIFSLGLVFFYVLTKGSHPFDCGDRYMREVNIRKGKYNLEGLDVLGDVSYEAKALIDAMLKPDPRVRPTAKEVMCHPFFWSAKERLSFLCDVSDHFELEPRDPPSEALATLEAYAPKVCRGDFLKILPKEFVDSLGKQRKYTGTRMLDLLRALRNKRFHYGDMHENLKKMVGPIPEGYLGFWTTRFPNLLITCCEVVYRMDLESTPQFCEYFKPRTP